ncbi:hypothetical protein LTS18_005910, partial [Coniosporium uncinatum]
TFKTLALGGRFDVKTKTITPSDPPLDFANKLWPVIQDHVLEWACGESSFVIVNMLEAHGFVARDDMVKRLKKGKKQLEAASKERDDGKRNAGARMVLEKIT